LGGSGSEGATLRGFQIRVLNVSQAAAENRLDGALDALAALERDLDRAAGEGLISAARYRGIDTALEAVRADVTRGLTAQAAAAAEAKAPVSAAQTPTVNVTAPEPEPATAPQPVQLPAEAPAVAPAPEPEPEPEPAAEEKDVPDAAKEAKGKGKGAGKP
jgi:outer membrane biosynthesis protein TonB